MNVRKLTVAAVLASAMAVAGTGLGQAEPAAPANANDVKYEAKLVDTASRDGKPVLVKGLDGKLLPGKTVVVTLDKGSFEVAKESPKVATKDAAKERAVGRVEIKDPKGKVVDSLPLSYNLDGHAYPVREEISKDKRTLKLVPETDRSKGAPLAELNVKKPAHVQKLKDVASPEENNLATQNLMTQLGVATTVGGLLGTGLGAVGGIALGGLIAGATCFIPPFFTCILTALPIMATMAGVGGIIGTLVGGGPVAIASGWDFVNTLQAPPGTSPYQVQLDQAAARESKIQADAMRLAAQPQPKAKKK